MNISDLLPMGLYVGLILVLTPLLGGYMARLFTGRRVLLERGLGALEWGIYRLAGTGPKQEQHWTGYAFSLLAFNLAGVLVLYLLQRVQPWLPLNPAELPAVPPGLAFNTAVSFVTNTNWQAYSGETTMSLFTQMMGLAVQNFLSAATGIVVAVALIRGFARGSAHTVGNFTVDVTRTILYLLLPLCLVGALVLVWQGVPQNFLSSVEATTLEGTHQIIAQGPVASQMMIKHLGTNGGGFFNANAAHPYENPTGLSNLIHMLAIFAIGAGLTNTFGRMVGDTRQGWALFGVMGILFVVGLGLLFWAESQPHPAVVALLGDGANLEGKEVRFGVATSVLFTAITTAASCGAVVAAHDSLMPLAGMIPMIFMMLGEVVIGGVGAGLYGILLFVLVTVFIAGLMVGRTPEYLGKKIEAAEIKLTVLALLVPPIGILGLGALGLLLGPAVSIPAEGPHGLSELLYAYTSATSNNGSAFAGFGGNTFWHNLLLGVAMLGGRFIVIIAVLAIAGKVAAKKVVPASAGTFPTRGGVFVALLLGVILVVGGLTFFPVLVLGPVVEHVLLGGGTLF